MIECELSLMLVMAIEGRAKYVHAQNFVQTRHKGIMPELETTSQS